MYEDVVIKIENLSKQYRLGLVGTGSLGHDINRWWARLRGKPDPYLKIGESNDRSQQSDSEYVWALKDINFDVRQGEVLGIIGQNGAGKSTLLKILSRVTAPTTGNVKVKGRIASLLEVGTGFHPELTGRENIYLNGAINGMTKVEVTRKLNEIVDFSGCERYIDTPVKRYSSGMMVRLGFAVAAHLEPEILIVDEVLAVGDAEFQKKCIGKMEDVAGLGRTVLFVSHNMSLVESLCERVIALKQGRIADEGTTGQVIQKYVAEDEATVRSIADIERRISDGRIWLENIILENKSGVQCSSIEVGRPVSFVFTVKVHDALHAPRLAFGVDDQIGRRLFTLATDLDPKFDLSLEKGKRVQLSCVIPELMLMPGRYQITVALSGRGELVDGLERIFSFNVVSRDFYGTGRELRANQGIVVCRSSWSSQN